MPMPLARRVRIFISYAHVDDALRARLRVHLGGLERDGLVQAWDDREIPAGEAWADEIDDRLNQADVIVLLVTADFIKSEYCYGKELKRALERNADRDDRAIVVPVILKACDWESSRFGRLQALPPGARPISKWPTEEDYFTAVAKGLRARIEQMVDPAGGWSQPLLTGLRDPRWWQRRRVWATLLGVLSLGALAAGWWWQAAAQAERAVAAGVQAMRSGRYLDAVQTLEPACERWLASRQACFALDKARLGSQLEQPDKLQLEPFAAQVEALQARAADDPDLLLLAAELALLDNRADRHAPALSDIDRAIELTGGDFPEAYFYLANRQLMAGRYAAALPLLDQALASPKTAPDHYLNMRGYARAQTGDLDGAVEDYELSAERGSISSRVDLAEVLWRRSEFVRASDQLQAASKALGSGDAPLPGRNALPWVLEVSGCNTVTLRQPDEKRCYARWMLRAGQTLAGGSAVEAGPARKDCGPEAGRIEDAVAAALHRASSGGMNASGQQRAADFAREHHLGIAATGEGT